MKHFPFVVYFLNILIYWGSAEDEIYDLTWEFSHKTIYPLQHTPFRLTKNETVSSKKFWAEEDKVYDLTWEFSRDTIYWVGQLPFTVTKDETVFGTEFSYAVREFCAAEHGGTHFDAPYHFNRDGLKVTEVDVRKLFPKGALVNLTEEAEQLGRNVQLTVKHLEDWEARNGPFEEGSVVLVQFGRSKYWTNRTQYLDLEGEEMNFPGFSNEAAQWIADSGKFYGVGLDTPSVDPGNTTDYFVHTVLSKHQLYNLENVKLLEPLPEKGFDLIVAPMKIEGGTGGPVRIFAKLPSHR